MTIPFRPVARSASGSTAARRRTWRAAAVGAAGAGSTAREDKEFRRILIFPQASVSKLDFDFYEYGMDRMRRFQSNAADPDYEAWLASV